MKYYILLFILYITSIASAQEQKTLDDIKQLAKLNFEMQFRSYKK